LSYNSSKSRKEYLVLTCGPPSISTSVLKGKGEDEESCSEDESSGDEENHTVSSHDALLLTYDSVLGDFFNRQVQLNA
jgi:hypothetical protein